MNRRSGNRFPFVAPGLLLLAAGGWLLSASGVQAQNRSGPAVSAPPALRAAAGPSAAQLAALDALTETLGGAALPPAALRELSRLLPEPADQVAWLLEWAERRCTQERSADAEQLQRLIEDALALWTGRGFLFEPAWRAAIEQRLKELPCLRPPTPPPAPPPSLPPSPPVQPPDPPRVENLAGMTDPAAFRAALATATLSQLSPTERARLVGKGVAPRRLGLPESDPAAAAWNTLVDLARAGSESEIFWKALKSESALRASLETIGIRPVYALLLNGLGLDGVDLPRADLGLNNPAAWQQQAASLEAEGQWLWAVVAQIVQVAAGSGAPAPDRALFERLAPILADNPGDESARLRDVLPRWLSTGNIGGPPGERARRRAARQAAEQNFLAVWGRSGDNPAGHDALLGAMHAVKAAELGLSAAPPRLEALQARLSERRNVRNQPAPRILFLLEMTVVGGRYYGLLLGSSTCKFDQNDSFIGRKLGPEDNLAALVRQARGSACPEGGGTLPKDSRILIGLDGAGYRRDAIQQVERELGNLVTPTRGGDPSWLAYTPGAAALLVASDWTAEQVCRLLIPHRAAEAVPGVAWLGFQRTRGVGAPAGMIAPLAVDTCELIILNLDGAVPNLRMNTAMLQLMTEKKSGNAAALSTVPLIVAKAPAAGRR